MLSSGICHSPKDCSVSFSGSGIRQSPHTCCHIMLPNSSNIWPQIDICQRRRRHEHMKVVTVQMTLPQDIMASEINIRFVPSSEAHVQVRNVRARHGESVDSVQRAAVPVTLHGEHPGPVALLHAQRVPNGSSGLSSDSGSDSPIHNTVITVEDSLPVASDLAFQPLLGGVTGDPATGDVVSEEPAGQPQSSSSPGMAAEPEDTSPAAEASQSFAGAETALWQGMVTERRN